MKLSLGQKLLVVALIVLVGLAGVAFAGEWWNKRFIWKAEASFEVYKDALLTVPWTQEDELLTRPLTDPTIKTFYIKNNGGVAINVTVADESYENCTRSWTPAQTWIVISPGSSGVFTLTLSGFNEYGGFYAFRFNATKVS